MADLNDNNASLLVRLVGSDSTGSETSYVNAASASPARTDAGVVTRDIPYSPQTFSYYVVDAAIGNNKSMVALQNTSTSVVRIKSIKIVNSRTAATTGVVSDFRLFRISSFSGGTALTAGVYSTDQTLPGTITAATGATVSGEGTTVYNRWLWSSDEWGSGTLDTEASQVGSQQAAPAWRPQGHTTPITLRQNEGITIKHVVNSTNGTFDFLIEFTVE
jgi:hypothetical protein